MASASFAIKQLYLKISKLHPHTYDIDVKVHRCAIKLEDTALLAKLEPGDMIALEAKYHQKCIANLYNSARALVFNKSCYPHLHGIAFAEFVAFMKDLQKEHLSTTN